MLFKLTKNESQETVRFLLRVYSNINITKILMRNEKDEYFSLFVNTEPKSQMLLHSRGLVEVLLVLGSEYY